MAALPCFVVNALELLRRAIHRVGITVVTDGSVIAAVQTLAREGAVYLPFGLIRLLPVKRGQFGGQLAGVLLDPTFFEEIGEHWSLTVSVCRTF